MTDAEAQVFRTAVHEALDQYLDELLKVDRSGQGFARWCKGFLLFLRTNVQATRQRLFGRFEFAGEKLAGVPSPHKGIEAAGFMPSVK